jgi:hypothetical protein
MRPRALAGTWQRPIATRTRRQHGIDAPANALIARLIRLLEATRPHRVNSLHADAH